MFTIPWWHLFVTYVFLWLGLWVHPAWFWAAIASCFVQAVQFGIEDKSFLSFSCQVRYAMAAMFLPALWEPLRWFAWVPIAGLTARLALNYCLLARLMSLLPWNRKQPFTRRLFHDTIFSRPVRGGILGPAGTKPS